MVYKPFFVGFGHTKRRAKALNIALATLALAHINPQRQNSRGFSWIYFSSFHWLWSNYIHNIQNILKTFEQQIGPGKYGKVHFSGNYEIDPFALLFERTKTFSKFQTLKTPHNELCWVLLMARHIPHFTLSLHVLSVKLPIHTFHMEANPCIICVPVHGNLSKITDLWTGCATEVCVK